MSNAVSNGRNLLAIRSIDPHRIRPLPAPDARSASHLDLIRLRGSMTREIGDRLGDMPTVTPVFEGPGRFAPWESGLLKRRGSRGYVREVVLSIDGMSVLSARTLSTFGDPAVEVLRTLGDRPLAQVLFEDARWQRVTAHIPLIELGERRVGRACVWQYRLRRPSRILVEEFFEPVLGEFRR